MLRVFLEQNSVSSGEVMVHITLNRSELQTSDLHDDSQCYKIDNQEEEVAVL